jgi:periplasmic protein TonB
MLSLSMIKFCVAQQNTIVSYTNENGEPVKEKKASFLIQKRKLNDTLWEFHTYEIYGSMIKSFYTKDEQGLIKNGSYYSKINTGGDTVGYFTNNEKDKEWRIRTPSYRLLKKLEYDKGVLIIEKDSTEAKAEIQRNKTTDSSKRNIVFTKVEIESDFKGGQNAWASYLGKNLHYPERALKNRIQGTVIIQFIVNTKGKVEDVTVVKSVEYSLDQEALRIIQESPDWSPAVQNGVIVKSYKKQPIVFKF